jgi:hypothetical protein
MADGESSVDVDGSPPADGGDLPPPPGSPLSAAAADAAAAAAADAAVVDPSAAGLTASDLQIPYADLSFGPVIGSGSYGRVYRGHFRGHEVAIKEEQIRQKDLAKYLAGEIATLR